MNIATLIIINLWHEVNVNILKSLLKIFMTVLFTESSVFVAMGYRVYGRGIGVRFRTGARDFSLLHSNQTGPGAYPAPFPVGTGASFHGGKSART
jgi:hypothetical protein